MVTADEPEELTATGGWTEVRFFLEWTPYDKCLRHCRLAPGEAFSGMDATVTRALKLTLRLNRYTNGGENLGSFLW